MNEHIVKSYEDELNTLMAECARMGGLAESQVADSLDAIVKRDPELAHRVIALDEKLDVLEADIERKAIRLIALRQPMANDLRRTVAAMKIATNLERCGDLAKNIAKRTMICRGRTHDASDPFDRTHGSVGTGAPQTGFGCLYWLQ